MVKERDFRLDVMRILGSIAVVMIHVSGSLLVKLPQGDMTQWNILNMMDSMARFAVPLFFMISGALLIRSTTHSVGKTVSRIMGTILIPLLAWSVIYYFLLVKGEHTPSDFAVRFINRDFATHLWYLYVLVGLYLLAPIISPYFQQARKRDSFFFIGIWFMVQIVHQFMRDVFGMDLKYLGFDTRYFVGAAGYFVMGYVLYRCYEEYKGRLSRTMIMWIGLMGYVASTVLMAYFTYRDTIETGSVYLYWYNNFSILTFFQVASLFIAILAFKPTSPRWSKLANYTFGVYLVHFLLVIYLKPFISYVGTLPYFVLRLVAITLLVYTGSLVITYIIKKIPVLKRVV